jgi:hypothetical protein
MIHPITLQTAEQDRIEAVTLQLGKKLLGIGCVLIFRPDDQRQLLTQFRGKRVEVAYRDVRYQALCQQMTGGTIRGIHSVRRIKEGTNSLWMVVLARQHRQDSSHVRTLPPKKIHSHSVQIEERGTSASPAILLGMNATELTLTTEWSLGLSTLELAPFLFDATARTSWFPEIDLESSEGASWQYLPTSKGVGLDFAIEVAGDVSGIGSWSLIRQGRSSILRFEFRVVLLEDDAETFRASHEWVMSEVELALTSITSICAPDDADEVHLDERWGTEYMRQFGHDEQPHRLLYLRTTRKLVLRRIDIWSQRLRVKPWDANQDRGWELEDEPDHSPSALHRRGVPSRSYRSSSRGSCLSAIHFA